MANEINIIADYNPTVQDLVATIARDVWQRL